MNIPLNRLVLLALFALSFFACEKDEERAVLRPGGAAPNLSSTAPSVTLTKPTKGADALTLSATPSDYGVPAAVTYVLQLARKGTNFAEPASIALDKTLTKKFTVGEFNGLLTELGLPAGTAGEVEARVQSTVSPEVAPVYSNVVTISATPYLDIVARLASVNNDQVYEGYIYFENPVTNFTATLAPNFNQTFGDAGNGTTQVLKQDGADMIVNGAGFYLIKADLDANEWSATPITTWGVIGNATKDGWGSDQNMTYDPATRLWKATLDLVPGEMKFRANDDWGINMGDSNPKNGSLDYNGDNIPVTAAGQYEVVLDLNTPGGYKYTSTKK
jgi:hypothetical protein